MTNSDAIRTAAFDSFARLINALGQPSESRDPETLKAIFQKILSQSSKDEVSRQLQIANKDQFEAFNKRLRQMVERTREQDLKPSDPLTARNAKLAQLRFLSAIEALCENNAPLDLLPDLNAIEEVSDDERSRRQARAIELIIRSLVSERHGDQEGLIKRLRELFKEPVVKDWLAKADKHDVLSGTAFSELSTLFVDPTEFSGQKEKLFDPSPFLTLLKDKRKTIADFLNDIRGIRNALAHHKKLSKLQLLLLDIYFDEIVTPIQDGFDHDQTSVDPQRFFDATKDEVERYFASIKDDIQDVRDNVADLAATLNTVGKDVETVKTGVSHLGFQLKKHWWLGVAAIAMAAVTLTFTIRTSGKTDEISSGVKKIDHKLENVKQEISSDPRKELANIGVAWGKEQFINALKTSDLRIVGLFLDGQINLQENVTALNIAALFNKKTYASNEPVIKLMHSKGVDFLKAFVPEKNSLNPIGSALVSKNITGIQWLLDNNDRSALQDAAFGEMLAASVLNTYWCSEDKEALTGLELLVSAGIPTTQAYRKIMERLIEIGNPEPFPRVRDGELEACANHLQVLKRNTKDFKTIEAAVKAEGIKKIETWMVKLQQEIEINRDKSDADLILRIHAGGYSQPSYGQVKRENAQKIKQGKDRIRALSAT